jgi:HAD superfamily hydrolase (TIGR01509 family)
MPIWPGRADAMPIEAIVFDCDGVLVDSEPLSIGYECRALNALGWPISYEECLLRFVGLSQASANAIIEQELGRPLPEGFGERLQNEIVAAFDAELRPIPHVAEAIDAIDLPRCVASSSQPFRIRKALAVTGLLARFDPWIYSASMVARGKPFPDLFLHAASAMGVDPAACIVIEDSEAGLRAASAAGMTGVGFVGGGHARLPGYAERLRAAGAREVLADMRELASLVARLRHEA